jgi:hypothetical protein
MIDFAAWLKNPAAPRIVLVEVNVKSGGVETTRYLSTGAYVTAPTDTPANQQYLPVLTSGLQYTEKLDVEGTGGLSGGDLEIANNNGERDSWLNDVWDNRSIVAWIGDPSWQRSDFQMIFNGIVATIDSKDEKTLTLTILDKLQRLNTPATEQKIGDVNTTNPTNKDNLFKLAFGEVHNVTPELLDATQLKYQVHNGPIEDIIEVRDNGIPIAITKSLSDGTFTLSHSSAGVITASVQGDKNTTYVNTIAGVIRRMATNFGTATSRYTDSDIDLTNFSAFDTACPQPVGVFLESGDNVLTTCQELAKSVDARLVTSRSGLLRLIQVNINGTGTPVRIDTTQIIVGSLKISSRPLVQASIKLGFDKNYTVQDNLLTSIPDEHKKLFAQEWLTTTSTNATAKADYKLNAAPPQVDTMLLRRVDAAAEADRRVTLWSTPRNVFQFTGTSDLINSLTLGCAVTLVHPRYGLSNGKNGVVVSLSPNWFNGTIMVEVLI